MDAVLRAVEHAQVDLASVDGLAVSSFSLRPDHAIDLAWRLGLRLRWIMEDTNGGGSGINMLQHAVRAIESGDAETVVLVAGDRLDRASFRQLVEEYNVATARYLAPTGFGGPNALFAHLTLRHMERHGLERSDYGQIAVSQRRWAGLNPGAVYRDRLTMTDYLEAPAVAPPLGRYDCVPVVSGGDAIVVTSAGSRRAVAVGPIVNTMNVDNQGGDGLTTGLVGVQEGLWEKAGISPADVDLACVYDDYPAMVLIQLSDLGVIEDDDLRRFLARLDRENWPLNTSGGQLSAGQAGAAAGMHGLVEASLQLLGDAGARQVPQARHAVVSGYGMVLYRYGAVANAVVLKAPHG